jgi:hypothetical protein
MKGGFIVRSVLVFFILIMAINSAEASLIDSLGSYHAFDGDLLDELNVYNGTGSGFYYKGGIMYESIFTNSTNQTVVIDTDASHPYSISYTGTVTFNFWLRKDNDPSDNSYPVTRCQYNLAEFQIGTIIDGDGKFAFFADYTDNSVTQLWSEEPLNNNTWYMLTLIYDNSDMKLYINGVLEANTTFSDGPGTTNTADLCIGNQTSEREYDSYIDELGVWDRVLSYEEISELYNYGYGLNPYDGPELCSNGVMDGNEDDVDCGGSCPNRCEPFYTYLWIPLGNWSSQEEFESKAEPRADFFMEISPLQDCKNRVENIYVPINWTEENCPYIFDENWGSVLKGYVEQCADTYSSIFESSNYEKIIGFSSEHLCFNCFGVTKINNRYVYAETKFESIEHLEIVSHELGHTYGSCDEAHFGDLSGWDYQNSAWFFSCPNPWSSTHDEYNETHNHPCLENDTGLCVREGKCCGAYDYEASHYGGIYSADGNECDNETTYNVMGYGGTKRRCGFSLESYMELEDRIDCPLGSRSGEANLTITNVAYLGLLFNKSNTSQENISLEKSYVYYGRLPKKQNNSSLYELIVKDSNNITIDSNFLSVLFFDLISCANDLNCSSVSETNDTLEVVELKYNSTTWETLHIFKNNSLIYETNISAILCNQNDICDAKENYFGCPQDCPSGSNDNICDSQNEGICDPNCHYSSDPDCSLDLENFSVLSKNGTEILLGFKISNFWNNALSDINWTIYGAPGNVYSEINISLDANESSFVYLEYDFLFNGNYTITAKIQSNGMEDIEEINLEVI